MKSFLPTQKNNLAISDPYALPDRLWQFLIDKAELPKTKLWQDLGKSGIHKLTNLLCNDLYSVKGKTTFKEEFVTCGGVSLENIDCLLYTSPSPRDRG